jgi:hypothetical protein
VTAAKRIRVELDVGEVAERYGEWPDKGPERDGRRLTLLTDTARPRVGDDVRVLHVLEDVRPGRLLYLMGPKPVYGEELDGRPSTPPVPPGEDPFAPGLYDGLVVDSPGIDANFEVTAYRFDEPGRHEVVWRAGDLESNTLELTIGEQA